MQQLINIADTGNIMADTGNIMPPKIGSGDPLVREK